MTKTEIDIHRNYHLEQIDLWRSGAKATAGMPMDGKNYPINMAAEIAHHDRCLAALKEREKKGGLK